MAQETLLDSHIESGKILLNELDGRDFHIVTAMWFFYPDISEWKLLLYSPEFEKKDPILLYTEISKIIDFLSENIQGITLETIKLILKNDSLLKLFKSIIHVGGISTVRMTSNYFNGIYIDDALIYRNQS
jgi:hypothetical protein